MKYTFEQLPQSINTLHDKMDSIKALLLEGQKRERHSSYSDILTTGKPLNFLNFCTTLYTKVSAKSPFGYLVAQCFINA